MYSCPQSSKAGCSPSYAEAVYFYFFYGNKIDLSAVQEDKKYKTVNPVIEGGEDRSLINILLTVIGIFKA